MDAPAPICHPFFHIALVHPEIPQNAGNVGRLCLGVQARLHLVHPLGFRTDEKAVRRAGLDYWKNVDVQEHPDLPSFWAWVGSRRVWCASSHGTLPFSRVPYEEDDVLVFGRESVGLGPEVLEGRDAIHIPMVGATRSLNLSNAAAVVAYAALARIRPELF